MKDRFSLKIKPDPDNPEGPALIRIKLPAPIASLLAVVEESGEEGLTPVEFAALQTLGALKEAGLLEGEPV